MHINTPAAHTHPYDADLNYIKLCSFYFSCSFLKRHLQLRNGTSPNQCNLLEPEPKLLLTLCHYSFPALRKWRLARSNDSSGEIMEAKWKHISEPSQVLTLNNSFRHSRFKWLIRSCMQQAPPPLPAGSVDVSLCVLYHIYMCLIPCRR